MANDRTEQDRTEQATPLKDWEIYLRVLSYCGYLDQPSRFAADKTEQGRSKEDRDREHQNVQRMVTRVIQGLQEQYDERFGKAKQDMAELERAEQDRQYGTEQYEALRNQVSILDVDGRDDPTAPVGFSPGPWLGEFPRYATHLDRLLLEQPAKSHPVLFAPQIDSYFLEIPEQTVPPNDSWLCRDDGTGQWFLRVSKPLTVEQFLKMRNYYCRR